jgi:hypothetical protein
MGIYTIAPTEDDSPDHDGRTFAPIEATTVAMWRARGDEKSLYVTTDGGSLIPNESGIQDAKLIRMEVGESGWPLLQGV